MMNSESFLTNFGHIANAPNGVAVLREAILTLAMQGKLVKQDAKDVPAIELLQEVEAEKQKLAEELKIKLPKQLFEIGEEEMRYPLPVSWKWVRFGTIAWHNSGKTLDKQRNKGLLRDYITTSNLYWGKFDLRNLRQMLIKDEELERCTAKKGDLLICEGGEAGRAAVWPHDDEVSFQNHVHRARFYCDINPYFAYRFFEKLNATDEINQYRKGVGISSMSGKVLASIVFPLPPVAEQKRIVAKVEELMALCDQLEAQQQEREWRLPLLSRTCHTSFAEAPTSANLNRIFDETGAVSPDDLRKTILTLAVQGKLVHFDIEDTTQTVGDHVEFLNGYAFKSEWFKPDGIRLCRNSNVSHGILDWRNSVFVDTKVAKTFERFALSEGDIVLSLDRPLITTGLKVAQVRKVDLPCLLLQRVAKPIPKHDQIEMAFFLLWLKSSAFVDSIDPGRSKGVPHISTRQVERLPFGLPPLTVQRLIVDKVHQLMSFVDSLEAQQRDKNKLAEAFAKACVVSFTGTNVERAEKMKAPKTELVSVLKIGKKVKANTIAPLAILLSKHKGELSAKALWQQSGLEIDAFYQQLKTEIAQGWIAPPVEAEMIVLEEA